MADAMRSSITVYAERLTLDEFESILGSEFMDDSAYEVETGLWSEREPGRRLFWSASHFGWITENLPAKVEELIEMRADVSRIEVRVTNYDANPNDAVSASVTTRSGTVEYVPTLVPADFRDRIVAIKVLRQTEGDAAAWLAVGELLNLISEGSNL